MFLEESLEDDKFQPRKPVPFVIQCPFCKRVDCKDILFKKKKIPRQRIQPWMPAFINVAGDSCGIPINMDRAQPEYVNNQQREIDACARMLSYAI